MKAKARKKCHMRQAMRIPLLGRLRNSSWIKDGKRRKSHVAHWFSHFNQWKLKPRSNVLNNISLNNSDHLLSAKCSKRLASSRSNFWLNKCRATQHFLCFFEMLRYAQCIWPVTEHFFSSCVRSGWLLARSSALLSTFFTMFLPATEHH